MDEQEKRISLIQNSVLIILVIILASACFVLWNKKNEAERRAEEYKVLYDSLNDKIADSESYQSKYNEMISDMLSDAAAAEESGNLIKAVWHNAIWKKQDNETDKYTMSNGVFVSDFNDALSNLYADEAFAGKISELSNNQLHIINEMKNMVDPPEGFENAFKALESAYNSYINFTNVVIGCDGSLETFSNEFSEADEDFMQKYYAAEIYVKQ